MLQEDRYTISTAVSCGSWLSTSGALDSRISPFGNGTRAPLVFSAQISPPPLRRNAKQPGGAPYHSNSPPWNAGCDCRNSTACRYSDSIESGSSSWASTVRPAHSNGVGSQLSWLPVNPYGGAAPSHGSGTRQPSRPRSVWPDRSHTGSRNAQ